MHIGADLLTFEDEWQVAEPRIRAYCYRSLYDDSALADDAFSATQIRAWLGYASFQRRTSFLRWALLIAKREVLRVRAKRTRVVPQSPDDIPKQPPPPPDGPDQRESLQKAVVDAVAFGLLPKSEGDVLLARLRSEEAKPAWEDIGEQLAVPPGTCAVRHSRGIVKLRVFLFLRDLERLGGLAEVRQATKKASNANPPHRLTDREIAVFEACVLSNASRDPTRSELVLLREACAKVIRFLSLELA